MSSPIALSAFALRQAPALVALVRGLLGVPLDEARALEVVFEIDAHVAAASAPLRFALALSLDGLRMLPLFVIGRFALLESLTDEELARFLERLDRSPRLGLPLVAMKTLACIAFYELPGELARVGYVTARRRYLAAAAKPEGQ